MNKYVFSVCDLDTEKLQIKSLSAISLEDCKDEIMNMYNEYSDALEWDDFLDDLNDHNIIISQIKDIEEL